MNHTPDSTTTGNGDGFDPRQAADLLDRTTQQTRRQIEPFPPWLLAVRGILALVALGAVWLMVRGQHPYRHPPAAAVLIAIAFGFLNLLATVAVARLATSGVSGKSRLRPAEITAVTAVWVGVFVIMGVLAANGASDAVLYGLYPVTAPLIAAGAAWAGIMAVRADWRKFGTAAAVAITGVAGLFAGPAGVWLVAGVGLCVTLLASAAVVARRQHRGVVRP